jgi:integrase
MQNQEKTAPVNIPENINSRESSTSNSAGLPHKTDAAENVTKVSFRESSGNQPPRKLPNAAKRTREYLTSDEVTRLMKAAESVGRHGFRDSTLILVTFRHGFRVSEVALLRWDQIDFKLGQMHVRRSKNGVPATHPVSGTEMRALRRLQREYDASPYVFTTERGGPITDATIRKLVQRAGELAGLGPHVHPHQLRHATGFKLANQGVDTRSLQAFMGHRSINSTVVYTELDAGRFKGFWQD